VVRIAKSSHKHPGQRKVNRLVNTPLGTVAGMRIESGNQQSRSGDDQRVTGGILARLNGPGGLEAFTTQVRAVRGCRRPVRLSGRVIGIGDGGRPDVHFDTRTLPDGVLLKACGSRRESVCPPCSSLYRGDAFALVAAGLRGGKGIPEAIGDHPAVLLTLTAPSFGAVHRKRPDGTCHPWGVRCPHGRALVCGRRHGGSDEALGQALCPDCYDYEGAVLFNAGVSELWRRTTIYALRALGALLGLSARAASRRLRLSYVKVVEFQRRGSVHLHILVRADVRGEEHGEAPPGIGADMLATALHIAARKVSAPVPSADDGRRMAWGEQVDAIVVTDVENGRRRAASYLAKYATKGSDEHGVLDHRLRSGTLRDGRIPDHLRALVMTAWQLGEHPDAGPGWLRQWAHTCGFRGHFLTKSRRYSTTFTALRDERQRWRIDQGQPEDVLGLEVIGLREWAFEGSGYLSAGDVCLARTVEEQLALGRSFARDAQLEPDVATEVPE